MSDDVPEYFYTIDLGPVMGPRLERLAVAVGWNDREELAARLVAMAIEFAERDQAADDAEFEQERAEILAALADRLPDDRADGSPFDLDDDIPF